MIFDDCDWLRAFHSVDYEALLYTQEKLIMCMNSEAGAEVAMKRYVGKMLADVNG